jgi:archaellum component FlaC
MYILHYSKMYTILFLRLILCTQIINTKGLITVRTQNKESKKMQINKKLTTIAVTTLLVLSMFAFALPANAVITLAGGAAPSTGAVGSKTLLAVTGASPGSQIQTYWENLAGMVIGNQSTYADATGAVNVVVTIPDATAGLHSIIVRDIATGATAGATFTVTPSITLSATRGIPGDSITVNGTGFAASDNITITFDGVDLTAAVTTSSDTGNFTGGFVVPNLAYGDYPVVATDNETTPNVSPAVTFTIGASVSITPNSGPSGTVVTAAGRGFTHTAGLEITLTIDGFPVLNTTTIRTNADGTFTGQFLVPSGSGGFAASTTRKEVVATDGTIVGSTSVAAGFRLTRVTAITISPTSAPPGGSVTITGSGFAQIAGTTVSIRFGTGPAGTFEVATMTTDADGNFTGTVPIPNLPTQAYFINATDTKGLNATIGFTIAITALFDSPASGPTGTVVSLTGFGFGQTGATTFNVTLGGVLMTPTSDLVSALASGATSFTVPTMAAGAQTLVVTDANGLTSSTTFTITETSTLTVNPTQAPVGLSGLMLTVRNFAAGEVVDFFISNASYTTPLTVNPGTGFTTLTINGSLILVGTFTVPSLDLGAYTIIANTTDGMFNATTPFTIGAAVISISPSRSPAVYSQGETVSFNVQSSFPYAFSMTVKDPNGYPATAISVGSGQWVPLTSAVGSPQVVPYALTSFMLPSDAPTGMWTWSTMVGTSALSGNFTVNAAIAGTQLNQTLSQINATLNSMNSTLLSYLQSINATVIAINGNTATLSTSIGTITTSINSMQSTVSGLSGSISSISSGVATIQTDLGTVKTSLSNIDPVIGLIAGDTTEIKTTLGTITTSLSSIGTTVTSINGNMATIQTDLGTLSGTVTSVSGNIATIQTSLGTMQTDISNLQNSVNGLQSDITNAKSATEGLSPLIIVAIVLALIAAIAAIASIVLMRRKIAG